MYSRVAAEFAFTFNWQAQRYTTENINYKVGNKTGLIYIIIDISLNIMSSFNRFNKRKFIK